MTEANRRLFDSMEAAFDWTRRSDRPQRVSVGGERWKLYPSGRAEKINPKTEKGSGSGAAIVTLEAKHTPGPGHIDVSYVDEDDRQRILITAAPLGYELANVLINTAPDAFSRDIIATLRNMAFALLRNTEGR